MLSKLKSGATPRTAALAFAAVLAGAGLFSAATPAEARDYPYCLTSPGYGYPGDCNYASYGQCRAAASGRLADCIVNPRAAFREPRHRDYRTYGQRW
ncbi:DUF3551 domain-containing protein [Rhodopseudomonas palustris]|uniref:DUF3551 domain-containing protein n=1 Tax=Rhodopseudomonas palustris TaxID=1076 RepID=A0AAX3DX77_RHOPL|nr:DUF3551 domain-containing protein [Rhodopseudomonas palustris]AVT78563.1 hypothetical protein RPPS3_45010 [Rhodopseudomonas palustris]UYO39440.1 DUF3551 domain-containing protein [Rhodopseudomonas palustris]UYO48784.1 DUF3551 domain-containing protein [Rhodopseudomonas palustris]UYO53531.1 DUF3551 domain-containing protein [Rhodopseudomonas palustris]